MTVRFLLNGELRELASCDPTQTVLNLLRYDLSLTGSKEGCAEGDCGACTVLLGELRGETVQWRALNACILFVPMLDGRALVTVEGLAPRGRLNPVQQAMVDLHGSQCGFCTPGIVMSLQALSLGALGTIGAEVGDVLAGNLCRCTGYGPILAAAKVIGRVTTDETELVDSLKSVQRKDMLRLAWTDRSSGQVRQWFSPRTPEALSKLLLEHPEARMVAGATDVALWVTKRHRTVATIISVAEIEALRTIAVDESDVRLGAAVRYSEAAKAFAVLHPDMTELLRRIAGTQVRNAGTVGGNIANGSPIGDTPPPLIALGAMLTLRRGSERREIPIEDFFLEYGKQALQPGEFLESLRVPRASADAIVRVVKLSKRFDSDISAVCAACVVSVEDGAVVRARIAFGGMAGTPKRALTCENALIGEPWTPATLSRAAAALAEDFSPYNDVRGTAAYRLRVAANIVESLWGDPERASPRQLHQLEATGG